MKSMTKIAAKMSFIRSGPNVLTEFLVRIAILSAFCYLETVEPFDRILPHSTLITDCKYPRHESYIPGPVMWCGVVIVPLVLSLIAWIVLSDTNDAMEILLSWSLALGITAVLTDMMKVIVGRHRPDFFYRCFPDGVETDGFECTGDPTVINDGKKSFPSGHSSLSFCSLGFASLWLAGRLEVLSSRRGSGYRVSVCLAPLVLALCVALSRTCDYHHHWQVVKLWLPLFGITAVIIYVLVGSLLGYLVTLFCYNQYYNSLTSELSGIPLIVSNTLVTRSRLELSPSKFPFNAESTPLLVSGGGGLKKEVNKWI